MGTAVITPKIATSSGENFTEGRLGPLAQIPSYELVLPRFSRPIRGKVFLKSTLGLTGMEVSVTTLRPGAAIPFLHRHEAHEELYLFIGGRGEMQVDDQVFAVEEGSVVRVAPAGARSLRAAADSELRYVCIQARNGTMPDAEAADDGRPAETAPRWRKP